MIGFTGFIDKLVVTKEGTWFCSLTPVKALVKKTSFLLFDAQGGQHLPQITRNLVQLYNAENIAWVKNRNCCRPLLLLCMTMGPLAQSQFIMLTFWIPLIGRLRSVRTVFLLSSKIIWCIARDNNS